ncbi:InlB B-repeat-containing protein, partial [uncultured Treponema sp.]|uniref:InlB B-repeat-containing protein n=1 Tax=uncultured Treponema sp. TaxID=162155 RepID=UPI0026135BD0
MLLALSAVIAGCKIDSDSTTEYTLTFNSNGGSGEMNPQTAEEGAEITIAQNAFTYDGYDFTSWNTAADGSGTSYKAGEKLTLTADITLYAQWEKIIFCTIKFDANGGEGKIPDDITIASGKQTTLPAV